MQKTIYIKEHRNKDEFFWKTLCVVFDNEALGFLERLLTSNNFEYRITEHGYYNSKLFKDIQG